MEESRKKPPKHNELPPLIDNVPEDHKKFMKDICLRMLEHPAYGQSGYEWTTRDFEMGAPLGHGKFVRVNLARERNTQFMIAMMVLFKTELEEGNAGRQVLREIEIQCRLKHPALALELPSQGELFKILRRAPNCRFDEPRVAKYTYQVADALHCCHINNVIHFTYRCR